MEFSSFFWLEDIMPNTATHQWSACLILAGFLASGCAPDEEKIFNPDYVSPNPPAVISSVDPPDSGLAVADYLTISGSNFTSPPQSNQVTFDAVAAPVVSGSPTSLVVQAPNYVKDSVALRIAAFKADKFSNTVYYHLKAAVGEFGDLSREEEGLAVATDVAGNLYAGVLYGVGTKIVRVTPAGVRSDFGIYSTDGSRRIQGMKMGPNATLYIAATRGLQRGIWTFAAGDPVPPAAPNYVSFPGRSPSDLDFDPLKNIWVSFFLTNVVASVDGAKGVRYFPLVGPGRSIRFFGSHIYVAGNFMLTPGDTTRGVVRAEVFAADSLGPFEVYYDLSTLYGSLPYEAYAVTFSSDGFMYVGTDSPDGIVLVTPGGGSSQAYYKPLFQPRIISFAWGDATTLYCTRSASTVALSHIFAIKSKKTSAPYYGFQ